MTEFIGNFDPKINKPLDSRQFVADEEARLAIQYLNKGLLVYQEDNDTWYQPLVNAATLNGSGGAYTEIADWKEAPLLGETGAAGLNGLDGADILTDEGIPGDEIGQNGDLYFDELSNNLYKKVAGTWGTAIANLKGDAGVGLNNTGAWSAAASYFEGDYVFDDSTADPLIDSLFIFSGTGPFTSATKPSVDTANWIELQAPQGPAGPAGDPFEIDAEVSLNDALVASIESTSGGTALQPYRVAVLNDTRTVTTNNATATYVEIQGDMEGRVIAWNGTTWDNYAQFRGPQGPTGFLIGGASNQTARYNGTSGAWEASSVIQNDGSKAIFSSTPTINGNGINFNSASATYRIAFNTDNNINIGFGLASSALSTVKPYIQLSANSLYGAFLGTGVKWGINTTSPSTTLDVNGTLRIRGLLTAGIVKNSATGVLSTSSTIDYNTEISNLPTIPTAASELEAEAEVVSNKYISPATLGQWFADTKANDAHTWTLKQTFTAAPRFNSVTASQYLKVDGNKDLTSVATIPFSDISSKPATLSGYGITDAQPLDGDLTAIAALSGTSGILRKTAANTWSLFTGTYLTGSGTETYIPKYDSSNVLTNSYLLENLNGGNSTLSYISSFGNNRFYQFHPSSTQYGMMSIPSSSTRPKYTVAAIDTVVTDDSVNAAGYIIEARSVGNSFLNNIPIFSLKNYTTRIFGVNKEYNIFIKNIRNSLSDTPSGGGYLYVEDGALKYKGSSGTVTTIAIA
jgi:hypothetical protein